MKHIIKNKWLWITLFVEILLLGASIALILTLCIKAVQLSALIFVCVVFVFVAGITLVRFMYKSLKDINAQLKKELTLLEEHYAPLIDKLDDIDKFRHEARNYLSLLETKTNDVEELVELTNDIIDYSKSLSDTRYCDNKYLNAIISEKHKACAKLDIKFESAIVFSSDLPIDDRDICACFMNLLENAITANNVDFDTNSKWINIRANVIGNYLIIKQSNSVFKDVKFDSHGRLITTKLNDEDHGLGMRIIDNIAKKYDGYTEFEFDNGVFHSNIYLEIK